MSYYIDVNGHKYTWPDRYITAAQIRDLVSVPQEHGVWQSTDRSTDPPVEDRADLEDNGGFSIPRFFTGPRLTTQGNVGVNETSDAAQPQGNGGPNA